MNLFFKFLSIIKSVWLNFRYLPFNQAVKLPLLVSYDTEFKCYRDGRIVLPDAVRFGMIHIGFHEVTVATKTRTTLRIWGCLHFKGTAFIGRSTRFYVGEGAQLILGDDFKISASSAIMCCEKIEFGKNIQFSWDCLVMDSDTHPVIYEDGRESQINKPVQFGDDIWIGCRCTILKGSFIPSNCVIGANTTITAQKFEENSVIAGNPPRVMRKIKGWKL